MDDLGILKTKNTIFLSSLPKGTTSIVVKPENGLRISAVIAPQKVKIRLVTQRDTERLDNETKKIVKCNLTTPDLLMSIKYTDIPRFKSVPVYDISFFVIDIKSIDKIHTTPYRLSNVHEDGSICWGDFPIPSNLKLAFNTYFGSLFNSELTFSESEDDDDGYENVYGPDYLSFVKRYRTKILKTQKFKDRTEFICGSKFWAAPKGADAVLVSDDKFVLKQIPEKHWFRRAGANPIIIALANQEDDFWILESGNFKFKVSKDSATIQPSLNKTLNDAKKKYLKLGTNIV